MHLEPGVGNTTSRRACCVSRMAKLTTVECRRSSFRRWMGAKHGYLMRTKAKRGYLRKGEAQLSPSRRSVVISDCASLGVTVLRPGGLRACGPRAPGEPSAVCGRAAAKVSSYPFDSGRGRAFASWPAGVSGSVRVPLPSKACAGLDLQGPKVGGYLRTASVMWSSCPLVLSS